MVKRLKDFTDLNRTTGAPIFSVVFNHLNQNLPLYLLTKVGENELEYMYDTGYKLFKVRQYEKALKIFIYLGMLNQHDGRFMLSAALCYLNMKQYSKACLAFLQIKAHYGNELDPHVNMHLAECFHALHHSIGVIESLKEAIKFYTGKSQYATHLKAATEMLEACSAHSEEIDESVFEEEEEEIEEDEDDEDLEDLEDTDARNQ